MHIYVSHCLLINHHEYLNSYTKFQVSIWSIRPCAKKNRKKWLIDWNREYMVFWENEVGAHRTKCARDLKICMFVLNNMKIDICRMVEGKVKGKKIYIILSGNLSKIEKMIALAHTFRVEQKKKIFYFYPSLDHCPLFLNHGVPQQKLT